MMTTPSLKRSFPGVKKIFGACLTTLWLSACGGAGDKLDDSLEEAETNRSASITFINNLNEMASFYIKISDVSRNIFDDQYQVMEVLSREASYPYLYRWHDSLSKTEFAVRDSISQNQSATVKETLGGDGNYWLLAWSDEEQYQLSLLAKSPQDQENGYSIRIFASRDYPVYLNGDVTPITQAEKGQVTASYQVTDCAFGLTLGPYPVDFCQQAYEGRAYLVVIDDQGNIVTAQE